MKQLREHIRKEIKSLMEKKYSAPPEIVNVLKNDLRMNPIIRYVDYLKAADTIPKSYEVFLRNGRSFFIIYESFSIAIKIGPKKYFLGNLDEKAEAIKHINRLLTDPIFDPTQGEEGTGEETGGTSEEEPTEEPEA